MTQTEPITYWTENRIAFLRERHGKMPASGIARILGCTRNMVIGKMSRLGLLGKVGPRPSSIARKARIKMFRAAPSMPAIGKPVKAFTRGYRPRPEPKATTPPPDTPNVTLEHRTGCAWPTNEGGPFLFCNAPTEHSPYCQHHIERMYTVKGEPNGRKNQMDDDNAGPWQRHAQGGNELAASCG